MSKKAVSAVDVRGKLVFLRNDFNVPLNAQQGISDDTRIREALPTYRYLLENGAKIVAASHLGRPKGEVIAECSLKPVAKRLEELLRRPVRFPGQIIGVDVEKGKTGLSAGEIMLLENLRFHPGEMKNDESLARELAKGVAVYVDDAFGAIHRAHASIERITHFVPLAVAGLLLKKEIEYLSLAIENPPSNYLVILGGAKVSDKIPVITNLLKKARTVLIGGAMAYTFLKAQGFQTGKSKVEDDQLETCRRIMAEAQKLGVKFLLPVDHIAAIKIDPHITIRMIKPGDEIPPEMMGLDIGPDTIKRYCQEIERAELIVWNGPMGVFEVDTFSAGTVEIARAIAGTKATSIVGGGDSVAAVRQAGVADRISHISTGGGASLEFLAGEKLPGIEALMEEK